ncbi:MAG: response regulator transcription factor [Spirochaetaceae bacterium]|nr:response regulator transcription factor [Spirochaetaceae bacterium]
MSQTLRYRLLVVEDEPDVLDILNYLFTAEGYEVSPAASAEEAWRQLKQQPPDLVVLDVELPGESGLGFCRTVKPLGIPIIMLSAHDTDVEVVAGLETGADDYVRKPFNNRELLLRVRKILDRSDRLGGVHPTFRVRIQDLEIDRSTAQVRRDGKDIHLTPTEWNILNLLLSKRGTAHSVDAILSGVWHTSQLYGGAQMVKVHIRRLRQKIERDPREPKIALNRWGRGYLVP